MNGDTRFAALELENRQGVVQTLRGNLQRERPLKSAADGRSVDAGEPKRSGDRHSRQNADAEDAVTDSPDRDLYDMHRHKIHRALRFLYCREFLFQTLPVGGVGSLVKYFPPQKFLCGAAGAPQLVNAWIV